MLELKFDSIIFKENKTFVAHSPKLDVSTCGNTIEEVRKNLKITVRLFLEVPEKMGTFENILIEAGYRERETNFWMTP